MDLKQIKELMTAMQRAGMKKIMIKQKGGEEVHLERETAEHHHAAPAAFHPSFVPHAAPVREEPKAAAPAKETKEEAPGKFITAPLVGMFYASPSPDEAAFVKVGDRVNENTVVCIIEAMKVMNEVKAGVSGTVVEVLVDNAHAVEFGTKLFRVE